MENYNQANEDKKFMRMVKRIAFTFFCAWEGLGLFAAWALDDWMQIVYANIVILVISFFACAFWLSGKVIK